VWDRDTGYFSNAPESCSACSKEFGAFRRKHHCRNCGRLGASLPPLFFLLHFLSHVPVFCHGARGRAVGSLSVLFIVPL
jgi:hypothetical protein